MQLHLISERFVRYYRSLGFKELSGTSLLHPSIPMTFVMSAGLAQVETAMAQVGRQSPENDYVLVQNCFRHFDVGRIGRSALHLSLFEMPGAFSFGHNSRQTVIRRMWNFLTQDLAVAPDYLWATYFVGGEISGHYFDEDADSRAGWLDVGLSDNRVIGLGVNHNFWKQGGGIDGQETSRKCGPNTELFFDRGPSLNCNRKCGPGCRCGRFVEVANSLFIYAEIDVETEALSLMAEPFTETVIGTERVAMALTGQPTVFDIETIKPLVETLRSFYTNNQRQENLLDLVEYEYILIDHVRALLFLVADGAPPPGKGGRRRLIRILIRRVLAQIRLLPLESPRCLPVLIDLAVTLAGNRYPQLAYGREMLLAYINAEAPVFEQTLSRGYRQLDRLLARSESAVLDGKQLVSLVKQFGIPVALLKTALARKGLEFREHEFLAAIEQWRHTALSSNTASR